MVSTDCIFNGIFVVNCAFSVIFTEPYSAHNFPMIVYVFVLVCFGLFSLLTVLRLRYCNRLRHLLDQVKYSAHVTLVIVELLLTGPIKNVYYPFVTSWGVLYFLEKVGVPLEFQGSFRVYCFVQLLCPFSIRLNSEHSCKGSSPGTDNIHYEILKQLPWSAKIILLDMYMYNQKQSLSQYWNLENMRMRQKTIVQFHWQTVSVKSWKKWLVNASLGSWKKLIFQRRTIWF
jgi:hypothetical protein